MVQLPKAFNASEHEPMGFTQVPEGDYVVQITKTEMKGNSERAKDPSGKKLAITLDIMQGKYKGKKIFTNLNIINKNPQAVEIAYKELRSISDAIGIAQVTDTQILHGKPMRVHAVEGDFGNEITKYASMDGATAPAGGVSNPFEDGSEEYITEQSEGMPQDDPFAQD